MEKLFGTDGIRGLAGKSPLTRAEVIRLGRAAGTVLHKKFPHEKIRLFAVRDTRASGGWLLDCLAAGLQQMGVDVYDGGVLNTPAVAHLVKAHRFHSGAVISASHNPPAFNGIKFFNTYGQKWPDPWEAEVEKLFKAPSFPKSVIGNLASLKTLDPRLRHSRMTTSKGRYSDAVGLRLNAEIFADDYKEFLMGTLPPKLDFSGLRIALDCSHGSNSRTAPEVFRLLKATVFVIGASPTGNNINVSCGSQNTKKLSELVRRKKCHAGIAFDGDGDRVIMVDEKGEVARADGCLPKNLAPAMPLRSQ